MIEKKHFEMIFWLLLLCNCALSSLDFNKFGPGKLDLSIKLCFVNDVVFVVVYLSGREKHFFFLLEDGAAFAALAAVAQGTSASACSAS